jgi:hypothetical protein
VSRVDDLLAAPRGRGLCAAMRWTEDDVFAALRRTVDNAAYWQEPLDADEIDAPDDAFSPIAERVLRSGEIEWWRAAAALDDQWYVDLQDARDASPPPALTGSDGALIRWRDEEAGAAESMREAFRGGHGAENVSGTWWSAPIVPGLSATSRQLPGHGPAGLWLVEDELGWRRARCWPVRPARDPRVYEVHGPDDWAQLARTFPLDVTESRSPDWARSTGRHGRWVVPDWPAVAAEYDAVHVSTWGYLTTAGLPVAVNGAASLLAGWSPDQTYWLTDCLELVGAAVDYVVDDAGAWGPAAPITAP